MAALSSGILRRLSAGKLIFLLLHDGFLSVLLLNVGTKCLDKNKLFFILYKKVT